MDIQKFIEMKIGSDKITHFFAGGWIGCIPCVIHFQNSAFWGVLFALSGGILKELYDEIFRKTEFNLADLIATALGGLVSGSAVYFFN